MGKQSSNKTVAPTEKLQDVDFDLFKALEAIDRKDYGWFNGLTEEQQRKFTAYMLLHWISAVSGNTTLQSYYLLSTNQTANKYMLNEVLQRHPGLQWLMLCAASPGIGKQFHQWIPHLPEKFGLLKEKVTTKAVSDYLDKIYKGAGKDQIASYTREWVEDQNHKYRISRILKTANLGDIDALSKILTSDDLDEYDRRSGG